ncbi:unnamed protein product [Closterium sp. Yama58-4]|nr:unnamed protein product [Closterium sp. Yama58-4]
MLAATSFGWVAKQIDMLTSEKGRSGVSIENIKTKGLRALQDNMVEYICKRIAEKRSAAPTSQAVSLADGAERQTAPQAAVAAQHQGTARVSAEGGNGGGGGDAAAEEASGRQGPELDDVEELRRENWLLRAENARLAALLDEEKARLDRFFVGVRGLFDKVNELADQVADSDQTAAERLRNATSAMSTTITGNITGSFDEAWKLMKTFAEQASAWLLDFDNPEGKMAYARAEAVSVLAEHVDTVVGDAKRGLEEYISNHLASAQVNIATAVTHKLAVQPPPPPQPTPPAPTPALPEELLKSFKADISKAVKEATQQSFLASGMKIMTEMIGTVAPGRRGSSQSANDADHGADGSRGPSALPSANDADQAQRREADKQGQKRTSGRDGSVSVKRSKGADGSRGPGGSKPAAQSVVDQLKMKAGWKVIRSSHSKGDGSGGAEGGTADEASGGKGVRDKEIPTSQTAKDGGARTAKGPSVAVAGSTSIPRNPPAATTAPAGQSGANNDGPAIAAPPAPAAPSAAKGDAKAPVAKRDGPSAAMVPAGGNALRELLHRMETHRMDVQQPPVVDAGLAKTARRSVTPQVAGTSTGAPPAAPQVAARPLADPKSAFLRAQLGAHKAVAPPVTQPETGKSATPTSVNAAAPTPGAAVVDVAADKGVRAALATGGRADRHADIAVIQAHFEAAKRPEHAPALAIMDTAHVEPSATHGGGSAEPTPATDAVAERNAGRKGKDDTGKGKAVSQRSTRAMSAGKEMSDENGKKAGGNQDKKGGKGKSAKTKEEEEDEAVGEGKKEHRRRGHGIRHDKSGDGLGWVGEIKVNVENRYIGKSRDKMELAYEHSIAYVVYDGYVIKVLMDELTVLKPGELEEWKGVWEEVKFLPTGMWTVMWARGLCHPRARFDDILSRYRGYTGSGDALHDVLLPAIWFPVVENTKEGKEETEAFMSSAMALAASACALWCFVETGASVLGVVGEGKAAAMVAGAGEKRAKDFKKVMHEVIDLARNREAPAGEVAHNVAPPLQRQAVDKAFKEGVVGVEADIIARATVETLAFWGMCPVVGPKLKEHGIDVPCDTQMEYDMEHRGRKGEKVKQGKGSKRNKRQTGKQGKDSTDA